MAHTLHLCGVRHRTKSLRAALFEFGMVLEGEPRRKFWEVLGEFYPTNLKECPEKTCRKMFAGRNDAVYCSDACRMKEYRRRKGK